MYKIFYHYSHF